MCTFKLEEQLLGKAPRIALQIVPPASDAIHLLAQVEVLLLPARALLVASFRADFSMVFSSSNWPTEASFCSARAVLSSASF